MQLESQETDVPKGRKCNYTFVYLAPAVYILLVASVEALIVQGALLAQQVHFRHPQEALRVRCVLQERSRRLLAHIIQEHAQRVQQGPMHCKDPPLARNVK